MTFSPRKLRPFVSATISAAVLVLSSCISSRSLIEDLAKTPHHPVQDSVRYASMNSFQQDFLYLTEMMPEDDRLLRAIPALKERMNINVELASPADFIPEVPG